LSFAYAHSIMRFAVDRAALHTGAPRKRASMQRHWLSDVRKSISRAIQRSALALGRGINVKFGLIAG